MMFKRQTADRTNGDTQAAGYTGFVIDAWFGPIHFLHTLGHFPLRGQNSLIGANPAAGAAFNTPLWINLMNLMTLPADGNCGTRANASPAATALFGYCISHFRPPILQLCRPNRGQPGCFGLEPLSPGPTRSAPNTCAAWRDSQSGCPGSDRFPGVGCLKLSG